MTGSARGFERIAMGGTDDVGREIGRVYAKATGRYAVYSTPERVQVLYADDPAVQRAQRRRLASLACLRSEIDGALAPWRNASPRWRLSAAASQYDGRIAAGLVEALEGNLDSGRRILLMVRAEINCERTSRAQLYYLLSTIGVALVFLLPCMAALAGVPGWAAASAPATRTVWLAVTTGVVGTVYSIALSLRTRDVTNDRRWLDHLTDAGVRLCIGAIAGFVVAEVLLTGTLQLKLGEIRLIDEAGRILPTTPNIAFVLLAGFIAGFAERFVPDLLNSYSKEAVPAVTPPPPSAPPPPIGQNATAGGVGAATTAAPAPPPAPASMPAAGPPTADGGTPGSPEAPDVLTLDGGSAIGGADAAAFDPAAPPDPAASDANGDPAPRP